MNLQVQDPSLIQFLPVVHLLSFVLYPVLVLRKYPITHNVIVAIVWQKAIE